MADSYESQNNSMKGGGIGEQNQIKNLKFVAYIQTRKPGNFSRSRGEQL